MKRLCVCIMFLLLFVSFASAAEVVTYRDNRAVFKTITLGALAADAATVALPTMTGCRLYQVDIVSSADTSITFSIHNSLGNLLFTDTGDLTGVGASTAPTMQYAIPEGQVPTYTLSGLASGTATVQITVLE